MATTQYRIGPEDVLEINVWRNKDLSKTVMVRPDGRISLPLIGDVRATGLTPQQLTNELRERYLKFLEEPNVSVMVKETNSYTFYVMGQVATPGRYFLKSKMTLLQAITIAGGFTPLADRSRIVVLRPNGRDTESRMTVSYIDIVLKDHANDNVVLSRGDTIVVPSETSVLLY